MKGGIHMNLRVGGVSRLIFPDYSYCKKCNTTWNMANPLAVEYDESGGGCIALCQKCWCDSNVEERVKYYKNVIEKWQKTDENMLQVLVENIIHNKNIIHLK